MSSTQLLGSLRTRITKLVQKYADNDVRSVSSHELQVELEIIKSYYDKMIILNEKVLEEAYAAEKSDAEILLLEDRSEEYTKRLLSLKLEMTNTIQDRINNTNHMNEAGTNPTRSHIQLPKLKLPHFSADLGKDNMTCAVFFTTFEHLIIDYNLDEYQKFNLLEGQCSGRAHAMVTSLDVTNQTYTEAKNILFQAFADEMSQKYEVIAKLTELKMSAFADPYIYYAEFCKIVNSLTKLKVIMADVGGYFIWHGLNEQFRDLLSNAINKSHPTYKEIAANFLQVANRYKPSVVQTNTTTSLVTEVKTEKTKNTKTDICLLCSNGNHKLSRCTKFDTPQSKTQRLKNLKICLKCLNPDCSLGEKCTFQVSGKCHKCKIKHWSFLCSVEPKSKGSNGAYTQNKNRVKINTSSSVIGTHVTNFGDSLLPFLYTKANVVGHEKETISTVLDIGSQHSLLTHDLADKLRLKVIEKNVPLCVKGFNSNREVKSKLVLFPFIMDGKTHEVQCLCVPEIGVNLEIPLLNSLTKRLRAANLQTAFDFDQCTNGQISGFQFVLGSRDWHIVHTLKSGVVNEGRSNTCYFKANGTYILIGSVEDWLENIRYLNRPKIENNKDSLYCSKNPNHISTKVTALSMHKNERKEKSQNKKTNRRSKNQSSVAELDNFD